MKVIELYKGPYARISRAEAEALCNVQGKLFGDYLIIDSSLPDLHKRLGYARLVGTLGFYLTHPELTDITPLVTGYYKFRFKGVSLETKQQILRFTPQINHPVDLEKPQITLLFVQVDDQILCILNPQENTDRFDDRRMHLNPAPHPSSLHPRLARALINLTGIETGILYDPFCGAGGILIEAGLIGLTPLGVDIDPIQIKRARLNLAHYELTAQLQEGDSTRLINPHDYLVTDIAYGKNTKSETTLIDSFLQLLPQVLLKRAVIGVPSSYDYESVIKKIEGISVIDSFDHYLHKSLSKKILVIEKQ